MVRGTSGRIVQQTFQKQKALAFSREGFLLFNPGNDLVSHKVALAVPSAQRGLTSVFGMGTGVALSIQSPETCKKFQVFDSSILMGKRDERANL